MRQPAITAITATTTLAAAAALAACSYSAPSAPQAPPDAAGIIISPPGPPPPNGVTVAVTVDGAPFAGAPVYFLNPDSSVAAATETDPTGVAGAAPADGGSVTVLLRAIGDGHAEDGLDRLYTFAGVHARDALHVDIRPVPLGHGVVYATSLASTEPGAATYAVSSPCSDEPSFLDGNGSGSVVLVGCGTKADLVVVAQDVNGAAIDAATIVGQPLIDPGVPDGGQFGSAALSLSPAFAALGTALAVTGANAMFASADGSVAVLDPTGRPFFTASNSAPIDNGTASMQLPAVAPAAPGELALVSASFAPAGSAAGQQLVASWGPAAASYALDAAPALLPELATAPALSGAQIAWTETATDGEAPDLARAELVLSRPGVPDSTSWAWHVVAPRGAGPGIALPTLPFDGHFDYNPAATDAAAFGELVLAHVPGGYDAARGTAFGDLSRPTGMTGALTIETLFAPPPQL